MKRLALIAVAVVAAAGALLLPACTHTVKVEPIDVSVRPIHLTVDINLKVDRALDDFFDFEKDQGAHAPEGGGG